MALDGIFTKYLIEELLNELVNNRLEEVYYNNDNFIFRFYFQKKRTFLNINLKARFVGAYIVNNPLSKESSNSFLNILKRNLEGGILNNITQYKTDRVFIFHFTYYDLLKGPIERELIFEAMGKYANLILIENNIIIDVYKRNFSLDGRMLVPKATFDYFKTDKLDANLLNINNISNPKDITNNYLGISQRLAKHLYDNHLNIKDINLNPTLSLTQNRAYFFNIFNDNTISFNTLSEALENRLEEIIDYKTKYFTFINNLLTKVNRKKSNLLKQKDNAHLLLNQKEYGDLIYSSGLNLSEKRASLNDLILDSNLTLNQNAQKFYKNYQKGKRGITFIDNEIISLNNLIDTYETYLIELQLTNDNNLNQFDVILKPYGFKTSKKIEKKKKDAILTINYNEAIYIVGKNAYQNGLIMNELGKPFDYWFHIRDDKGSHVLLKTSHLTNDLILNAATLAAHFSNLKDSSKITVNYAMFKNVKKITGMPPSFVKLKDEKTVIIDIDKKRLHNLLDNA